MNRRSAFCIPFQSTAEDFQYPFRSRISARSVHSFTPIMRTQIVPSRAALSAIRHISTIFSVADSDDTPPPKAILFSPPCCRWRGCTPDHPVPIRFRIRFHSGGANWKVLLTFDLMLVKSFLLVLFILSHFASLWDAYGVFLFLRSTLSPSVSSLRNNAEHG